MGAQNAIAEANLVATSDAFSIIYKWQMPVGPQRYSEKYKGRACQRFLPNTSFPIIWAVCRHFPRCAPKLAADRS